MFLFQHQKRLDTILCLDFEYFPQISILKFDFLPRMEYTEPRKHLGGFAMLLQFSVTNHRSIRDTAVISMKASTDKSLSDCLISPDEKKQLVPVLALYGANAAGKSNVLHALLLMLLLRNRKVKLTLFVFSLVVCYSRIYLGVHYPFAVHYNVLLLLSSPKS